MKSQSQFYFVRSWMSSRFPLQFRVIDCHVHNQRYRRYRRWKRIDQHRCMRKNDRLRIPPATPVCWLEEPLEYRSLCRQDKMFSQVSLGIVSYSEMNFPMKLSWSLCVSSVATDDEGEVPSRSFLKRQAMVIVDSKSRRKGFRQQPKRK